MPLSIQQQKKRVVAIRLISGQYMTAEFTLSRHLNPYSAEHANYMR